MTDINYFKRLAKNLFKDYQTQSSYIHTDGYSYYKYDPKYFDIDEIFVSFDLDEENFSLMKAQHVIAKMVGFQKWGDLIKASESEFELAKLRFDNQDIISLEDWDMYILHAEHINNTIFDSDARLEIFKHIFLSGGDFGSFTQDFRLNKDIDCASDNDISVEDEAEIIISSLPLNNEDREEFIEAANEVFEEVLSRIESSNFEMTRKLWDVEDYVDNFLTKEMLPIDKDYALSLIDAFLVHHVIGLAMQADKMVEQF